MGSILRYGNKQEKETEEEMECEYKGFTKRKMSLEDITNPLQYIECIIAFDVRDWSEDRRLAAIYAIVFGWGGDEDNEPSDCWSEVKEKFGWSVEGVERLKKFHEEWKRLREEE